LQNEHHLSALQPGARLNNYAIAAVLGAGGFGITYKAVEDITGRKVAIKEYLPSAYAVRDRDGERVRALSGGTAEDFAWGLDRFREEAKLLIDFRHPNIVPVLAYFEANATGYLVMSFEDGICLGDFLEARSVLSEAETRRFIVPLLDGVEDVHRHGFLHRDIKPDNIFIRGDGTPVLLDFGAARQALGEHSKNFTTLLTEGYAPFEQYAGSGNQGPWSDIYALAAVMFRCLMGKTPLPAPQRAVAKLRGLSDPLGPDIALLRSRFSPEFAAAISAGLAVVEQERPRSVAAFRDLIQAPAAPSAAMPDLAPPVSSATLVPDRAKVEGLRLPARPREGRRRRRAVAIASVLTALIAAGATVYVGDHRSWLPEAFRRAGSEPAAAAAPPAGRPKGAPAEAPMGPDGLKALAEHQQRQLDQAESERRQWETLRTAEAERKRREEEAAKEAERKRADEDRARRDDEERARKAEDDRRRADEQRRIRADEDRRRQQEDRARAAEPKPPRAAPAAPPSGNPERPRQTGPIPPELPGTRRTEPPRNPADALPDEGGARERRIQPREIDRRDAPANEDEY